MGQQKRLEGARHDPLDRGEPLALCPEGVTLLHHARLSPDGVIAITRPRAGPWPERLALLRRLERLQCVRFQTIRDDVRSGFTTALYSLTDMGRRAALGGRNDVSAASGKTNGRAARPARTGGTGQIR